MSFEERERGLKNNGPEYVVDHIAQCVCVCDPAVATFLIKIYPWKGDYIVITTFFILYYEFIYIFCRKNSSRAGFFPHVFFSLFDGFTIF